MSIQRMVHISEDVWIDPDHVVSVFEDSDSRYDPDITATAIELTTGRIHWNYELTALGVMKLLAGIYEPPPGVVPGDMYFAQFAVDYAAVGAEVGRGARRAMAERQGRSESAVAADVQEAIKRGMWLSAGPGRLGQPSPKARHFTEQDTR